jgi:hypothetical protein
MINTRPPKNTEGRDFERWMYSVSAKVGVSNTTIDDIDARSMNPVIGMIQEVKRELDSLIRDNRNLKTKIAEFERRIDQIEGEL